MPVVIQSSLCGKFRFRIDWGRGGGSGYLKLVQDRNFLLMSSLLMSSLRLDDSYDTYTHPLERVPQYLYCLNENCSRIPVSVALHNVICKKHFGSVHSYCWCI